MCTRARARCACVLSGYVDFLLNFARASEEFNLKRTLAMRILIRWLAVTHRVRRAARATKPNSNSVATAFERCARFSHRPVPYAIPTSMAIIAMQCVLFVHSLDEVYCVKRHKHAPFGMYMVKLPGAPD